MTNEAQTVFMRELEVELRDEEVQKLGELLAAKEKSREEVIADARNKASAFRETRRDLEKEISELAEKVNRRVEARQVKCTARFELDTNTKRIVRLDTGEVIEEVAMSDFEIQRIAQGEMAFTPDGETPAPAEGEESEASTEGEDDVRPTELRNRHAETERAVEEAEEPTKPAA